MCEKSRVRVVKVDTVFGFTRGCAVSNRSSHLNEETLFVQRVLFIEKVRLSTAEFCTATENSYVTGAQSLE
jgi:hypothetical protein